MNPAPLLESISFTERLESAPMRQTLAESPNFALVHDYESVFVLDKRDGSMREAGDHYGDPCAGLITPDEQWFVSVGEGVQCFSASGGLATFFRRGYPPLGPAFTVPAWFVTEVELESAHTVRVTIDPNAEESSEWSIDIDTETVTRLR